MSAGPLRDRIDVPRAGRRARQRVLDSLQAVALAAIAAALSWLVAHRVLGHAQPFFAPIAAAISLSTIHIQRGRRIAQMVGGVLLGIVVGDGLHGLLGGSTAALGVIVLMTLIVALALGAGFFGDGLMFPNQAVASAVLVVTLNRHGTGAERAVDAVVGGAVAFIIGVGLFPADPLSLLRDAEQDVLEILGAALTWVSEKLSAGQDPDEEWTLRTGFEIHRRLSALARARSTARASVRVAPRRWRLRAAVHAEIARTARLDLLANAVLSLIRAATLRLDTQSVPPPLLLAQIAALAAAIEGLAAAEPPWTTSLKSELSAPARTAIDYAAGLRVDRDQVVAAILRATARDLLAVIGEPAPDPPPAPDAPVALAE